MKQDMFDHQEEHLQLIEVELEKKKKTLYEEYFELNQKLDIVLNQIRKRKNSKE